MAVSGLCNVAQVTEAEVHQSVAPHRQGSVIMTADQKIIKARAGLLEIGRQLGHVSGACKIKGYSRDTSHRYQQLHDNVGKEALKDLSRRKPPPKNRVEPEIE